MGGKKRKVEDGDKAGASAKRGKNGEEDGGNLAARGRGKGKAKAKSKAEPGKGQEQVAEKAADDTGKDKKKKEDPPIVCQPVTRDAFNKLFRGTEPLVPSVAAPELVEQVEPPMGCEQTTPGSTNQADAPASGAPKPTPPVPVEMKLGSLVTFAQGLGSDCEQGDCERLSWMRDKLQKAEPHEFEALLKESMGHPLLEQHKSETYAKEGLTTDDWSYGDEAGDNVEDLVTFAVWLAAKPAVSVPCSSGPLVDPCVPSTETNLVGTEVDLTKETPQASDRDDFLASCMDEAARTLFVWDKEENMSKIAQKAASWSGLGEFCVATACSGTGSFEICFTEALKAFLKEFAGPEGKDAQVTVPFAVEITPFKQKFLSCALANLGGDGAEAPCIFEDIRHIASPEKRRCTTHGKACSLPQPESVFAFGAGFSCTSLSALNGEARQNTNAVAENKAVPTVDTFKGCIDIIQATRPLLVVLENVPRIDCPMDEEAESNLDQCLKVLENPSPDLTYKARPFLVNSLWFGLPQSRERVYICAVQTSSEKLAVSPQAFLDEVEANLKKLYKTPPAAASLLLPDDDPAVVAELERLSENRAKTGLTTGNTSDKSQSWVKMHMSLAEKRGISWPIAPLHPEVTQSPWYETLPARMREVLALADHERAKKDVAFADIYHSATRYNTGGKQHVPIVLPSSVLFSFERNRLVLGRELLRYQGLFYPRSLLNNFSEAQLGNLAGNACSSTVQGSILMAMLAALALSTDSEEEETQGIGDLLSRLGQIANGDSVAAAK